MSKVRTTILRNLNELREIFKYENGTLLRRRRNNVGWYETTTKANLSNGYTYISVKFSGGVKISALKHHIVWFLHNDSLLGEIDHIDQNKLNNAIENLRDVSKSENQHNRSKQSRSSSGYKGVHKHSSGDWQAKIGFGGKVKHIGLFKSKEEAAKAYNEAAAKYHGATRSLNVV